jgi:hypothetical protein
VKTYWDTSAAINALFSPEVFAQLNDGQHVTRLHLLAEFFSTMTGRGVSIVEEGGQVQRMVLNQSDCAAWLRSFAEKVQFEELTPEEALASLDKAEELGVQGSRIYDYWHALVSDKTKADKLLTRNTAHFADLAGNIAWP